jgi:glycosyltransferase involved in cell wall biosynthesis
MRILIISQYFYPEPGAPTNRLLSFARCFASAGHEVTVLCEFPNYPSGKLAGGDRFRFYRKENFENFTIVRSMVIPTRRSGLIMRLINYWSFMLSAFIVGIFLRNPDLIFVSSPPLFVGPAAVWLGKVKRVPLITDVRDLWPEDAIAMGQLSNKWAIWGGRVTARFLYRNSRLIITISRGIKDKLEYLVPDKRIDIIVNGSSVPDLYPDIKGRTQNADGPFIVCYAGILGLGQPVEDLIAVAQATSDDPSISYLIVGDGVRRKRLMQSARSIGLTNVRFAGGVPFEKSLELLAGCDAAFVSLTSNEVFKSAIPSKFFDCMALGLPIILGVDGEAREILEGNETGLFYRSGDWRDLKDKIYYLKNNQGIACRFGENGRRLVFERFRRSRLAAQLEAIISAQFGIQG